MVIPKEERAQRLSVSLRAPRRGLVLGHFGGCFHGHHEVNKSTRATRTLVPALFSYSYTWYARFVVNGCRLLGGTFFAGEHHTGTPFMTLGVVVLVVSVAPGVPRSPTRRFIGSSSVHDFHIHIISYHIYHTWNRSWLSCSQILVYTGITTFFCSINRSGFLRL